MLKHEEKGGKVRMMCWVANVLKHTHCEAAQHSLSTSRLVRRGKKNKLMNLRGGGIPAILDSS